MPTDLSAFEAFAAKLHKMRRALQQDLETIENSWWIQLAEKDPVLWNRYLSTTEQLGKVEADLQRLEKAIKRGA